MNHSYRFIAVASASPACKIEPDLLERGGIELFQSTGFNSFTGQTKSARPIRTERLFPLKLNG